MSDELRIRLDWVPPVGMNINAHTHWRRKHPDEQNTHLLARERAKDVLRGTTWEPPHMPVLVAVIHWPKRRKKRDADNAITSVKWAVDGVCKAIGIDDRQFVTSMAFQKKDPEGNGFTDIIIRPATLDERRLAS